MEKRLVMNNANMMNLIANNWVVFPFVSIKIKKAFVMKSVYWL